MTPERERELLDRIQRLEEMNSVLQDKLDAIYEIVAPEDFGADGEISGLVNIDIGSGPKN